MLSALLHAAFFGDKVNQVEASSLALELAGGRRSISSEDAGEGELGDRHMLSRFGMLSRL